MMASDRAPRRAAAPARILIADDHEMARAGIRAMLHNVHDFAITGEAESGVDAIEQCRSLSPDLVLMDMRMPGMDGLATTRQIKREFPQISVMIVTMHEDPDYLIEAVKAGVAGYILKDASRAELVSAVRQVLNGESALHGAVMTRALQQLAVGDRFGDREERAPAPLAPLTPRERDVLRLIARGMTNVEIASRLALSRGTVKVHVEHIIAKLGVSDRTQAAVRALELHLV